MFLYKWSKSRAKGRLGFAWRGAAIGALGGLEFAAIMFDGSGPNGSTAAMMEALGKAGLLLALSVGAFGWLGLIMVDRVYVAQEHQYQVLLSQGATPPEAPPAMTNKDRMPLYFVIATVVIIGGFIAVLMVMAANGWL
jgi:hypothetical protein